MEQRPPEPSSRTWKQKFGVLLDKAMSRSVWVKLHAERWGRCR